MAQNPVGMPGGGGDEDIGGRFVRGAVWMLASKLVERGLGLVSTLVLARLLMPADFGLVAMAAPFVALVELLGALGMDAALIQRRDLKRSHLDTVFTINLIVGLAVATSLWLLAPLAAAYFNEPRLEAVIKWLSLGNLVQGLTNPGFVLFRKAIDMRPEVVVLIAKKLSSMTVAIAAALLIGNYWALVWGTLISRFIGVGLTYTLTKYRPRLSLSARSEILSFSAWVWVSQLVSFFHFRANDLIIGRFLGPSQLAFFNLAMELGSTATGEAVTAISRAAFPTLAKLASESQRLRLGLRNILSGVAMFALPAALGVAATRELLVLVLLGERWMPSVEILASLAISSAVLGIMGQMSNVYWALGRPRAATAIAVIAVLVLIGTSLLVIPTQGLAGVNIAYPVMAATVTLGHYVLLRRVLPEFSTRDWLVAFARPLAAALCMYVLVRLVMVWIGGVSGSLAGILPLLLTILFGACVYATSLGALWRLSGSPDGPEALVWMKLKQFALSAATLSRKR